ncbi:hypothetical protein REPUB_Repub17cG0154200 [Reevesia pubescens]
MSFSTDHVIIIANWIAKNNTNPNFLFTASPSFLQSTASSFYGQSHFLWPPLSARSARRLSPEMEEFNYTNTHQVPKIEKMVVNCGIGDAAQNAKGLEAAMNEMALITGQRPVKTRARNSIATFKIREGQPLGIAVTLRGNVMYSFLDRLINLGLPRTRDFQGLNPNSFDGHGNYSIGIHEQSVFLEIRFDALGKPRGMDICITTAAKSDKEGQKLLALMGMPFREGGGGSAVQQRRKKLKAHHFEKKGGRGGRR